MYIFDYTVNLIKSADCIFLFYYRPISASMILSGLSLILLIFIVLKIKKNFFSDHSIINHAKKKFDQKTNNTQNTKKIKAKILNRETHSKKYVIVPKEEWEEYQQFKKNRDNQDSGK